MDAIIAEIIEHEGTAQELAEFAHRMDVDGHHATAETIRATSRARRVKGLELRGNLAALAIADHEATEGSD
ncbi:hypothetical protein DK412_04580 [Methylobacterium sp. 17Sr1-1]|nr:hypothetical protein DK412_04580 [Methylobacterium sp. 17Sr1-1]